MDLFLYEFQVFRNAGRPASEFILKLHLLTLRLWVQTSGQPLYADIAKGYACTQYTAILQYGILN